MITRLFFTLVSLLGLVTSTFAQQKDAAQIMHDMEGLQVLGSVLYVAAHPDDENTRLISYFSNKEHYNTTYISLTRGGGGQNLLGKELGDLLGLLRTQELLEARHIDHGEQTFSRARDFGFSKNPDETLAIWDKDEVLADLIWAIRKYRPDIIVNRFDHNSAGETHGHHTSSALLSVEAFGLSNRRDIYPEQLQYVKPWQPTREFFNTSWWFYGSEEAFEAADKSKMVSVNIGEYFPLLGESNTEIAGRSRSMHKCQGFGNAGSRGNTQEYLNLILGTPTDNVDPMYDINTTWTRVQGGAPIKDKLNSIIADFDYSDPAASVPGLLEVRKLISLIDDDFWKHQKLQDIDEVISQCIGLYVAIDAEKELYSTGSTIKGSTEVVNRSSLPLVLKSIQTPDGKVHTLNQSFESNESTKIPIEFVASSDYRETNAYWLNQTPTLGMYQVENQDMIGLAETKPLTSRFLFAINNAEFVYDAPVQYIYTDPVKAEIKDPVYVLPPVVVTTIPESMIIQGDNGVTLDLSVRAISDISQGQISVEAPQGWTVTPSSVSISDLKEGKEQSAQFMIKGPTGNHQTEIKVTTKIGLTTYDRKLVTVDYDHIDRQQVLLPATINVSKLDLVIPDMQVGYIDGAGDKIPESLTSIGIPVTTLVEADLTPENLGQYDAIVMGIRVLNTNDRIDYMMPALLEYTKNGGTLIFQYNTSRGLKTTNFAPYSIELGRDRVTDEFAPMTELQPEHPVFNFPNKIDSEDYDNWVQERGLYFADKWAEEYTALFSSHDKGEDPLDGSLLVAPYGDGMYVYTGISWFRQLPAGVPGAYKLFINLLALQNPEK